jgi:hypothetical protein
MKIGIMQPYFFPYIGYFQLINAVDKFIIYDNIKYTKKGWINRNRFLQNGCDAIFSLPLKKGSHQLNIFERQISDDFNPTELLSLFKGSYLKAPYYKEVSVLLEVIISYDHDNLFHYLHNSISEICRYLEIDTEIVISSELDVDHSLVSPDRVFALCESVGATEYINPIGGVDLYDKSQFLIKGIELGFLATNPIHYKQFKDPFLSSLSIIDVLMFNSKESITQLLGEYQLK